MASIVSAGTTSATALNMSADTTGILQLASNNGTVALTISTAQVVTFTNPPNATGGGSVATNTAYGTGALASNTSGASGVAIGYQTLQANTTASANVAVGYQAGYSSTVSPQNVFIGYQAGYTSNVTSGGNGYQTLVGYKAGFGLTTGYTNTFIGSKGSTGTGAGHYVTTGNNNTIIGGYDGNQGSLDIRTGVNYIVLSDGDGNPRNFIDTNGWSYTLQGQPKVAVSSHQFGGANANSYELIVFNNNATPASEYIVDIRFTASSPNNTSARFLACTDTTNEKAAILSNGGYLSRNNSYGTYSDVKLKENIVDASSKLNDVMQLQVRNFNFKDDNLKQIGFIAQEFQQVFPSMVEENQDKDKEGNFLNSTTKSIKTSVLVPILVKAIQELNAKVTDLEEQVLNLGVK
jgi:hypothetical protein